MTEGMKKTTFKAAIILVIIAIIFQVFVIFSTRWVYIEDNGDTFGQEGLYYRCDDNGNLTFCQTLDDYLLSVNCTTPGKFY